MAWTNVKPSTLVTVRGVKVGLIGVTTPDTPALTIGANVVGLTFAPLVPVITREAMALRARGATVVIVLAHAGGRCTKLDEPGNLSSCDQMAEIVQVARQLPAGLVDVIAAGHTHQAIAHDVGGIAVVEALFDRAVVLARRPDGESVDRSCWSASGSFRRRTLWT